MPARFPRPEEDPIALAAIAAHVADPEAHSGKLHDKRIPVDGSVGITQLDPTLVLPDTMVPAGIARDAEVAASVNAEATTRATADSNHAALAGNGSHIPATGVTNTHVAAGAAIDETKLNLASDAAVGTASRRTLGTGSAQAAKGSVLDAFVKLPRQVLGRSTRYNAVASGKYLLQDNNLVADNTNLNVPGLFWFDPAFHLLSGYTLYLMVTFFQAAGGVAPTGTLRGGMYVAGDITGVAGSDKSVLGTKIAETPTTQPAASSHAAADSGWVDASGLTAGLYSLTLESSGLAATQGGTVRCVLWVSNR